MSMAGRIGPTQVEGNHAYRSSCSRSGGSRVPAHFRWFRSGPGDSAAALRQLLLLQGPDQDHSRKERRPEDRGACHSHANGHHRPGDDGHDRRHLEREWCRHVGDDSAGCLRREETGQVRLSRQFGAQERRHLERDRSGAQRPARRLADLGEVVRRSVRGHPRRDVDRHRHRHFALLRHQRVDAEGERLAQEVPAVETDRLTALWGKRGEVVRTH